MKPADKEAREMKESKAFSEKPTSQQQQASKARR